MDVKASSQWVFLLYPAIAGLFVVSGTGTQIGFIGLWLAAGVMHVSMAVLMFARPNSMLTNAVMLPWLLAPGVYGLAAANLERPFDGGMFELVSFFPIGVLIFTGIHLGKLGWQVIRNLGKKGLIAVWVLSTVLAGAVTSISISPLSTQPLLYVLLVPFLAMGWFYDCISRLLGSATKNEFFWLGVALIMLITEIALFAWQTVFSSILLTGYIGLLATIFSRGVCLGLPEKKVVDG